MKYGFFFSYSAVDKNAFIRPIAEELGRRKIRFWLDESEIGWGDSITLKIKEGLKSSRFMFNCLSEAFCERSWPEMEMSSLLSMQNGDGVKCVLPLILNSKERVLKQYPILAGFAYRTYEGGAVSVADHLKRLVTGAAYSGAYEIIIEAVNRGITERLIVPERASVAWVLRKLQTALGLNDVAETGGFTQFPIRWVLFHKDAEADWYNFPRYQKQRIRAVVRSKELGLKIATEKNACLKELSVTHQSVFYVCAIEDEDLWEQSGWEYA